ncbi:MAG TPA: type II secretion system secretin GspD [Bdellovibrionota bacterium]|nr:type II secretion system secretin GspD [Bdellovibrionota bacterium]
MARPKKVTDRKFEKSWLDWLEITAALTGLIGTATLIALLAEHSWAEPPGRGGFQSGARPFTNPYANAPGGRPGGPGPDDFYDDDDEEDLDFEERPPGFPPPRASQPSVSSPGGAPNPQQKAISMGGGSAGNVIQHAEPPKSIHVDNETGEGSKEVVTDFNFPDADIMDIAKTLGKLTGKNFILDKDVKGRITIISNSPVTVGDAWRAFLTALDINGFALIPSGNFIRIARSRDARDKQLKTYTGEHSPDTDTLVTRVFQLKYIDSEEVARTFRSFMPANSRIIPYQQTNTVIVTDTGSNISKLNKMLEILDVEGFDAGIEVISVKYASAVEISKLVDQLIPGTGAVPGQPGGPRFGAAAKFSAKRTKEGGIINNIIADDRTNNLIVHANTKGADQVRELVAKLDQRMPTPTGGGKVHVVSLQFADAEQLANTLNNLSQSTGGGFRPISGTGTGTGVNPIAQSLFEGAIKVSPDKATNSLVITASPSDFLTVQRVINKLDLPRDEVYVEIVIMEITLNREFAFSTNVINPTSGIGFTPNTDLYDFVANPLSQRGALLGFTSGGKREFTISGQKVEVSSVQGLIKAIQTNSNANVLATPQIIALDNSEATFESSEKIPVPTTTAVQGAGVSTSITKESVSLKMKIKPQINKMSNFVKLDIEAQLADISNRAPPAQVAGLAFATTERNAKTTVVVGDADSVVIGGLVRDKINDSVSKIPVLGDIPLLGWLFRAKNSTSEKTNLLIFLTPHIVRQYDKIRAVLDKKLKERDDFIEENAGGVDPLRKVRDEMIRNLPDIKELTKKPDTTATLGEDDSSPITQDGNPFSRRRARSENTTPPGPAVGTEIAPPFVPPNDGGPSSAAPETAPPPEPPT